MTARHVMSALFFALLAFGPLACDDDSDSRSENDAGGGADTAGGGVDVGADTGLSSGDVGAVGSSSDDEEFWSCSVTHLADVDREPTNYTCTAASDTGSYACDCGGEAVDQDAADGCGEALTAACSVALVADYCSSQDVGVCVDDDEVAAGWRCACGAAPDHPARSANACRDVLFASCAQSCDETSRGQCTPNLTTGEFDCMCADDREGSVDVVKCEHALSFVCSSPSCETSAGKCFEALDSVSFDCVCNNAETSTNLRYDDLGHDNGCQALESLCGPDENGSEACETTSTDGMSSGRCLGDPESSWSCSCETPSSSGEVALSADGRSCEAVLASFCPDAFD